MRQLVLDRRTFLGTLGPLAAPRAAEAQETRKVNRIGIGMLSSAVPRPGSVKDFGNGSAARSNRVPGVAPIGLRLARAMARIFAASPTTTVWPNSRMSGCGHWV
jgi:hypothetical protein